MLVLDLTCVQWKEFEMSLKPGTLVKYTSATAAEAHAAAALRRPAAAAAGRPGAALHCRWNLNWSWNEIEAKLTGIVLKNLENDRLQVRWFGINKTFNYEYEEYLEVVK